MTQHRLVHDYLDRLDRAAQHLPADQAQELRADIADHLDSALGPDATDAQVRDTLDRLGTPEELVASAQDPTAGQAAPARETGRRELGALICLIGAVLLFLAFPLNLLLWLAGLALLLLSTRWNVGEKILGAVVLGTGWIVPLVLGAMAWSETQCVQSNGGPVSCSGGPSGVATVLSWVAIAAWLALTAWTVWRLSRKARPER